MSLSAAAQGRFDLSGKRAWVIGGGGPRLGGAVSRALAEHGAELLLCDVNAEAAERTAEAIRRDGGQAEPYELDAGDEPQVQRCAEHIQQRFGQLDIMVNLAAFSRNRDERMDKSLDDWHAGLRVSLTGAFLLAREAGRLMRQSGGGSIVQFSSMYGLVSPQPDMYPPDTPLNPVDYGVAKAGVLQMVRYQAVNMARHNVRVNAIVPGPFPGEKHEDEPTFIENLKARVPMKRAGRMHEITGPVILLCSEAGSYMTGTQIVVDGGWLAQ